jgi:hypothetical protein
MKKRFPVFVVFFCILFAVSAKTVYVDNVKGKDGNPGTKALPVASIEKGLALLTVSDSMEVINTGKPYQRPYPGGTGRTLAVNHGGTLEKPMIINGNGAVVTGLSVIPAAKWKKDGEFYSLFFYPMSNQYKLNRKANYWLDRTRIWWVDGKAAPNCKSREELQKTPGGFWWNKAEKKVLFHLPSGRKLADLKIELPANSGFSFHAPHVIIKNFYVTHSWNDGFDSSGSNYKGIYKNCVAVENCGQGFSCHGTGQTYYEDCAAIRCASSGSCDVHWSISRYNRCIFYDNTYEAGVYTVDEGLHSYSDCIIAANNPSEQIWQKGASAQHFSNCLILGTPGKHVLLMEIGTVTFRNCTIRGGKGLCRVPGGGNGQLFIDSCVIRDMEEYAYSTPGTAHNRTKTRGNLYIGNPGILHNGKLYKEANWNDFPALQKRLERTSRIIDGKTAPEGLKLKNRYGTPIIPGAQLPQSVLKRFEQLKKINVSLAGVTFDK